MKNKSNNKMNNKYFLNAYHNPQLYYQLFKQRNNGNRLYLKRNLSYSLKNLKRKSITDNHDDDDTIKRKFNKNKYPLDCCYNGTINFHYVYKDDDCNQLDSIIETITVIYCPFCKYKPYYKATNIVIYPIQNKSNNTELKWTPFTEICVSNLIEHMNACHVHFKYDVYHDHERNLHILSTRDSSQDIQANTDDYFYYRPKNKKLILSESTPLEYDYRESISCVDIGLKITEKSSQKIQFYHTIVSQRMLDEELEFDSDDDIDNSKTMIQSNLDLLEFEDISVEEKFFMICWNNHIQSFPVYADCYMLPVCELFIARHINYIYRKQLRHNLLLHLLNMYDCGLLTNNEVQSLMLKADTIIISLRNNHINNNDTDNNNDTNNDTSNNSNNDTNNDTNNDKKTNTNTHDDNSK